MPRRRAGACAAALLTTLLSTAYAVAANRTLRLYLHNTAVHNLALCNDGTPSGYYFSPASDPASAALWIFHQQGGGWCWDAESCRARSGDLVSSSSWPSSVTASGLLNSTDPRLAAANVVFQPYCTSDAHTGDATSASVGFDFTFHMLGRHVLDATFSELVQAHGFGSEPGSQLLYSGCSAGARGVLYNLPRVPALLRSLLPVPGNLAVVGALLDSAFWLDLPPLAAQTSLMAQASAVYARANMSAVLNPACTSAQPAGEEWRCLLGQVSVPFLGATGIPFFLHAYTYDAFQLSVDWNMPFGTPPSTPAQLAFAQTFHNATISAALTDVIVAPPPNAAALLPACFKHCNTETTTFSTLATDGFTLEQAVVSWFFAITAQTRKLSEARTTRVSQSAPRFIIENCSGFNCGNDCPAPGSGLT